MTNSRANDQDRLLAQLDRPVECMICDKGHKPEKSMLAENAPGVLADIHENTVSMIDLIQSLKKDHDMHHATAATQVDVGAVSARIAELEATVQTLEGYFRFYSARRQLTIYSILLLAATTGCLGYNIITGPMVIGRLASILGVILSLVLLLMARATPYRRLG